MSKEAKFTAGDWELAEGKTYCAIKQVNTGAIIADMRTVNAVYNKHNANLIKAAPKLYDTLSVVLRVLKGETEFSPDEIDIVYIEDLLAEARV